MECVFGHWVWIEANSGLYFYHIKHKEVVYDNTPISLQKIKPTGNTIIPITITHTKPWTNIHHFLQHNENVKLQTLQETRCSYSPPQLALVQQMGMAGDSLQNALSIIIKLKCLWHKIRDELHKGTPVGISISAAELLALLLLTITQMYLYIRSKLKQLDMWVQVFDITLLNINFMWVAL